MSGRSSVEPEDRDELYELFIGVLTLFSLAVMVVGLLVGPGPVREVLGEIDWLICVIFLADFVRSLVRSRPRSAYLWPTGVIDLLGSIPAGLAFGPLRLLRLFRLLRIARVVRGRRPRELVSTFLARRAESAVYVIVLSALMVLTFGSLFVAYVEPPAVGSNIKDGGDAFWWAFVSITTVGYGDRYPVTAAGRLVGILTMTVGIGVFGVFTGYLSSVFLSSTVRGATSGEPKASDPEVATGRVLAELALVRQELADLERLVSASRGATSSGPRTAEGEGQDASGEGPPEGA